MTAAASESETPSYSLVRPWARVTKSAVEASGFCSRSLASFFQWEMKSCKAMAALFRPSFAFPPCARWSACSFRTVEALLR